MTAKDGNVILRSGIRVRWTGQYWIIRAPSGALVSCHGSRAYAMKKARRMDRVRRQEPV